MVQNIYSKEKPLTYPVIRKNLSKISVRQGIMMLIVVFLLLYYIIHKTYAIHDAVSLKSVLLFILLIFVALAFNFVFQKFKFGGEFTITDKEITITTTNHTVTYPIKDMTNFKMHSTAEDEKSTAMTAISKWLFGKSEGYSNSVHFTHNGKDIKMELYLKGKEDAEMFMQRAKDLNAV